MFFFRFFLSLIAQMEIHSLDDITHKKSIPSQEDKLDNLTNHDSRWNIANAFINLRKCAC